MCDQRILLDHHAAWFWRPGQAYRRRRRTLSSCRCPTATAISDASIDQALGPVDGVVVSSACAVIERVLPTGGGVVFAAMSPATSVAFDDRPARSCEMRLNNAVNSFR